MNSLILASTSVYRQSLLKKSGLSFQSLAPNCDEDEYKKHHPNPADLAATLARAKAESIFKKHPQSVVIGSDQVLEINGKAYGKAGSAEKACDQLMEFSGKTHQLLTAVCVLSPRGNFEHLQTTRLKMRPLTKETLQRYVLRDQSWDCAGSYKIEESGLLLFEEIQTDDWSGIQGLPLLWLTGVLQKLGFEIPA